MRILVVTAVDAERDAVVRELGSAHAVEVAGVPRVRAETAAGVVDVVSGGVGPVAAAIATTRALAARPYDAVVSAGLGGAFAGRAQVCDIVVADTVTFADLGARTDAGFLTLREMNLPQETSHMIAPNALSQRLTGAAGGIVSGQILTLACMTGTQADADELGNRYPHALAEAMEGFGVVEAAMRQPPIRRCVTEIRAISNLIGPRDPSAWQLSGAFDALAHAFALLLKEPLP